MQTASESPVLSVERLTIAFGARRVVDDVSFALLPGQTLCIAGESGSGKSMTSLAIMGLLPDGAVVPGGAIVFDNRDLLELGEGDMRQLRGKRMGMIFQEPMTSLNPLMTVEQQLAETLRRHERLTRTEIRRRILSMLDAVKLPQVEKRLAQYPHELSGGMRQRIMIAMAMLCQPEILIADEPTTALDVTIQAQILQLMRELQRDFATSLLLITHDMGVVAEMADEVVVMRQGRVEEQLPAPQLFSAPRADYTRRLLAAVPVLGAAPPLAPVTADKPLLSVRELTVRFPVRGPAFRPKRQVHAVENVSFDLFPGETLGLVGESGCGKSTTGKALLNMIPFNGSARLDGRELNGLRGAGLREVRRDIQMVFQDPYAALNSRKTLFELVGEPLLLYERLGETARRERTAELLAQVGLTADALTRYPHQFSGGQRQRICIARALALNPKVIIADESVSALDVSVQAQVLELLEGLRERYGLSYLFISHDMAVVERICHRVAVMFCGQIVEIGPRDQVLHYPRHPYTRRLLSAVPSLDVSRKRDFRPLLADMERPDPIKPAGYRSPPQRFHDYGGGHLAAC
ncbi:ABC transporter ATP-binding protein [Martelella alba]|uniref:Glutathione import ATP-binding protein GsiA n=1 Tax=Martelella alba TaxID=2590451 RepID=A0ABY2SR81_9HYPH|nr:ABC transporter ATP-binding protein [Martelella alba]TKI06534.1 ABC transporter ATP-binding protein [Martelella alba]